MAKKSMIARENKRLKMVEKFSKKRSDLKKIINSVSSPDAVSYTHLRAHETQ